MFIAAFAGVPVSAYGEAPVPAATDQAPTAAVNALVALSPGARVGTAEVPVVGGNVASARERALTDAMKQAVDQAILSMVPDPHATQPKTVVQVVGRARSYVRRYRTLEEGERGKGLYGMRIEADIDEGALLRAFDKAATAAGPATNSPAAAVAAPSYLLAGAGPPEALEAAAKALTALGARVQPAATPVAPTSDATDVGKLVASAAGAGLATVAFISGTATDEGKVRGPGVEAVTCVLSIRVLTAGTGLPVADESETVRAFAARPEAARSACFQRAAAAAVPRVVPAAAARVTPDVRTIVLDVDVVQPGAIPAVVKQVRALGSVSAVEVRRITVNRAELWVKSRLAAAAFAAALSRDTGAAVTFGPSGGDGRPRPRAGPAARSCFSLCRRAPGSRCARHNHGHGAEQANPTVTPPGVTRPGDARAPHADAPVPRVSLGARRGGRVLGFAGTVSAALGMVLWACAGCATARFAPPSAPLRISSNVPDAMVWVDDHLVAKVSDFAKGEKRLPAGFHRVEIRAPGYYSYYQELEVKPDAPVSVQAPLHQLLD